MSQSQPTEIMLEGGGSIVGGSARADVSLLSFNGGRGGLGGVCGRWLLEAAAALKRISER